MSLPLLFCRCCCRALIFFASFAAAALPPLRHALRAATMLTPLLILLRATLRASLFRRFRCRAIRRHACRHAACFSYAMPAADRYDVTRWRADAVARDITPLPLTHCRVTLRDDAVIATPVTVMMIPLPFVVRDMLCRAIADDATPYATHTRRRCCDDATLR